MRFNGVELNGLVIDGFTGEGYSADPTARRLQHTFKRFPSYHVPDAEQDLTWEFGNCCIDREPFATYPYAIVWWDDKEWLEAKRLMQTTESFATIRDRRRALIEAGMIIGSDEHDEEKAEFLSALLDNRGMITSACRDTRTPRSKHGMWMKTDPVYCDAVEEVKNLIGDKLEGAIIRKGENGDLSACKLILERKFPERGYGANQQVIEDDFGELNIEESLTLSEQKTFLKLVKKAEAYQMKQQKQLEKARES